MDALLLFSWSFTRAASSFKLPRWQDKTSDSLSSLPFRRMRSAFFRCFSDRLASLHSFLWVKKISSSATARKTP